VSDLILHKQDEAFIKFECEKSIAQELADYFTFFVPGYQFMPAYKNRLWDGKIRLADLRTYSIYHGLVPYIEKFCEERDYKLEIDAAVNNAESFSAIEANEFIEQLQLDKSIITEGIREYQYKSFLFAIRNRRMLLLSPTGSGKSLIQYLILRYLQHKDYQKGLLIVPTTSSHMVMMQTHIVIVSIQAKTNTPTSFLQLPRGNLSTRILLNTLNSLILY
jgi:hypothetical protein